jgi:hypothetical protein
MKNRPHSPLSKNFMRRFFGGTHFLRSLLDFSPCLGQDPFIICFGGEEESRSAHHTGSGSSAEEPDPTTPPVGPRNDEPHHNATSSFFWFRFVCGRHVCRAAPHAPTPSPLHNHLTDRQIVFFWDCLGSYSCVPVKRQLLWWTLRSCHEAGVVYYFENF